MMSWCGWWCRCGCSSSSLVQLLVRLVVLLRLLFLLVWLLVFEKMTMTVVLRYLFAVSSASVQSASSSPPVTPSLCINISSASLRSSPVYLSFRFLQKISLSLFLSSYAAQFPFISPSVPFLF